MPQLPQKGSWEVSPPGMARTPLPGLQCRDEIRARCGCPRRCIPHPEREPGVGNLAAKERTPGGRGRSSPFPLMLEREAGSRSQASRLSCGRSKAQHSCSLPLLGHHMSPPHMVLQSLGSAHGKRAAKPCWAVAEPYPKPLEVAALGEPLRGVWRNRSVRREQAWRSKQSLTTTPLSAKG